jgi:nuclear autoantigenic sperm protein
LILIIIMSADAPPANETFKADSAAESSISPSKSGDKLKLSEAMQFLNAGKRDYLCKDYASSVTALAEASRVMGEIYGETGVECADAYFYYGKALLELARLESGVIEGLPGGGSTQMSFLFD